VLGPYFYRFLGISKARRALPICRNRPIVDGPTIYMSCGKMKHYIDAQPGSDDFRQQFEAIRNAFLLQIEAVASSMPSCEFRACDVSGEPFAWVWNAEVFRNTGVAGSLPDARKFAANMIDQGMKFAFGTCLHDGKDVIWLTTWEEPEQGPVWPNGIKILKSNVHEGVQIGRINS